MNQAHQEVTVSGEEKPTRIVESLQIDFSYPVFFTKDLFSPGSTAFLEAVRFDNPKKEYRSLVIVDEGLHLAQPELSASIQAYFEGNSETLQLLAEPIVVPGGEQAKNDTRLALRIIESIRDLNIDRHSLVICAGGGALLDVVGFAAAISHRGIRHIRIPTTVLSQCDSGVGVKNGINLFGRKNFIGTFAPPFAVLNDFSLLRTLEYRDRMAGLAEAVKVALIRDTSFFEYLERNSAVISRGSIPDLHYPIRRCAELHLEHIRVSGDPFEFGSARPLDFGHWSAHKIESLTDYELRHGEAVSIGMAIDIQYAAIKGFLSATSAERVLSLLERLGLPLWHPVLDLQDSGNYRILEGLQEFREHIGGALSITLIDSIGKGFEVDQMDTRIVLEAIEVLKKRSN